MMRKKVLQLIISLLPFAGVALAAPSLQPDAVLNSPENHVFLDFPHLNPESGQLFSVQLTNVNDVQKVLTTVTPHTWRAGCVPTSAYMWATNLTALGFPQLLASIYNPTLRGAAREVQVIGSDEHYRDYFYPTDEDHAILADRSGYLAKDPVTNQTVYYYTNYARQPNSIADVLGTSMAVMQMSQGGTDIRMLMSGLNAWLHQSLAGVDVSMTVYNFARLDGSTGGRTWAEDPMLYDHKRLGPVLLSWTKNLDFQDPWEALVRAIDAGRAVMIATNTKANSGIDHMVAGIGYKTTADGTKWWACYDTWSTTIKWYKFENHSGQATWPAWLMGGLLDVVVTRKDGALEEHFAPNVLHKFYNTGSKAYFFTASPGEAAAVYNSNPAWKYQGPTFKVEGAIVAGEVPVYRFYNSVSSSHFYTASPSERDGVIKNLSTWYTYEGVAFFARTYQKDKFDLPVHRFYVHTTSSHFFSNNEAEVEHLKRYANPKYITYEGVAWFAPLADHNHMMQVHYNILPQLEGIDSRKADFTGTEGWIDYPNFPKP